MAFDITPYVDKTPAEVRELIREGVIDFPTAGMCRGYAQANLVILPPDICSPCLYFQWISGSRSQNI